MTEFSCNNGPQFGCLLVCIQGNVILSDGRRYLPVILQAVQRIGMAANDLLADPEGIVESVEGEVVCFRESPPRKKWKKGQRPKVVPVEQWALIEVSLLEVRKARTVYEFG